MRSKFKKLSEGRAAYPPEVKEKYGEALLNKLNSNEKLIKFIEDMYVKNSENVWTDERVSRALSYRLKKELSKDYEFISAFVCVELLSCKTEIKIICDAKLNFRNEGPRRFEYSAEEKELRDRAKDSLEAYKGMFTDSEIGFSVYMEMAAENIIQQIKAVKKWQ